MLRIIAASVALLASVILGCGESEDAGDAGPSSRIESQLDEHLAQSLDFWWQQGVGTRSEQLALAGAESGGALRLVVFDVPLDAAGWRSLFEATPDGAAFSRFDSISSRGVNQAVAATVSGRITNELGGRTSFERAVQAGVQAGAGEPLDIFVIGSALLAVPSSLSEDEREVLLDGLTIAHAAARRREADSGDAAAYAAAYGDALATIGWVSAGRESGELATGSTLLADLARPASAEPWLRALGLLE
jgi:hypothetical protein